ncbi:uncharacterized protein LOC112692650 [Sipha flava]|uniref:Uncharacterized protein LOC112692650 n=2 Tax=Sipha flava TaxID=143950 RepID=A0A8B8GL62_9HEMI|nr:uncharacterized protein LOC112692650 [Sipha flava]
MSQYEEVNAAASGALNSKTENMQDEGLVTRRTVKKYPMDRDLQSWRKRQTHQSGTPITTTMTPSFNRVNHFFLPKEEAIVLHTSKNAWIPPCLKAKDTNNGQPLNDEDLQIEDIRKKFLSILNKLSPGNMVPLTETIMSLPIETEKCMNTVIEILFQKAINEPSFTPQYAYICTGMHTKEVKLNDKKSKISFNKLLTKCCQERLNQMRVHEQTLAKERQAIDDCQDQDVKDQLKFKYDQDELAYRKKSIGNCRYMCELYKVGILTNRTLKTSINYLLKSPNEENLECACNILKHVGKTISHRATFNKLNEYMSAIYKTKIPTRIRFMIQDIIELKNNDWVPINARPKQEYCNTKALSNTEKLVPPEWNVVSRKNIPHNLKEQIQIKLPTEIQKVNALKNSKLPSITEKCDLEQPLLPNSSSDVESNKSLLLPCGGKLNENTKRSHSSDAEDIEIEEEIQKKYRAILDNLSSENIVPMAKQIISLPIKTDDCLKNVVQLLFQKAMDEPKLTPQIAHICSLMKDTVVKSKDQKSSPSFRKLLIDKCQSAFEAMFNRKQIVTKDRNEVESCKDKEKRKLLQSKFDQKELDHSRRSIANCRFICELLKVNILVPSILEMCAARLVQTSKETSIECVCVILKNAGNSFDFSGIIEKLHEYSIAHKQKLSSRMQSMILDTLELNNSDLI